MFAIFQQQIALSRNQIKKQDIVSIKEGLSNYTCVKTKPWRVLKNTKHKEKKRYFLACLIECREEYPSYFMMSLCKSKALKNYSNSPTDFKLAMKDCRSEYSKLKFSPKSTIPVTWHKDKIYFAGAGLNTTLKINKIMKVLVLKRLSEI